MAFDSSCLPNYLPDYYRRLFPSRLLIKWLSYGQNDYFQKREFAFILKDEVYLRYKSYTDVFEFERDLYKTVPEKVDIGAVYNYRPKEDRHKKDMCPVERELVFDIDMTDYDDLRTCCKGTSVCKKCWLFLVVAIEIIDAALEEDFGFTQKLWVFSGRRGVHCWIVDEIARKLSPSARSAIVDYLTLATGGDRQKAVELKSRCLHPSLKRPSCIVEKHFLKLMAQQDWLGTEEGVQKMLSLVPDLETRAFVQQEVNQCKTSIEKWKCFESIKDREQVPDECKFVVEEIMLQYAYPRIDANVTKGLGHLLKSPFCIHAKTGKVCVPLDTNDKHSLTEFNPDDVPRIDTLITELHDSNKEQPFLEAIENENNRKFFDYKKTSLKKSIQLFEQFVTQIRPAKDQNSNVSMEF